MCLGLASVQEKPDREGEEILAHPRLPAHLILQRQQQKRAKGDPGEARPFCPRQGLEKRDYGEKSRENQPEE